MREIPIIPSSIKRVSNGEVCIPASYGERQSNLIFLECLKPELMHIFLCIEISSSSIDRLAACQNSNIYVSLLSMSCIVL